MEMVAVESSNVAEIGYDPASRVLRVQYRDSSVYDHADVEPIEHEALMAVSSKGRYLQLLGKRKPGVRVGHVLELREPAVKVLDSFDAEDCCTEALWKALGNGTLNGKTEWTHEKCGTVWKAEMFGPLRKWTPQAMIEVFK